MKSVGVCEAKTQLSRLLNRVTRGERITITRYGVPIALMIRPLVGSRRPVEEVTSELKSFGRGRKLRGLPLRSLMGNGRR